MRRRRTVRTAGADEEIAARPFPQIVGKILSRHDPVALGHLPAAIQRGSHAEKPRRLLWIVDDGRVPFHESELMTRAVQGAHMGGRFLQAAADDIARLLRTGANRSADARSAEHT